LNCKVLDFPEQRTILLYTRATTRLLVYYVVIVPDSKIVVTGYAAMHDTIPDQYDIGMLDAQ
jgi:hypothetical protein